MERAVASIWPGGRFTADRRNATSPTRTTQMSPAEVPAERSARSAMSTASPFSAPTTSAIRSWYLHRPVGLGEHDHLAVGDDDRADAAHRVGSHVAPDVLELGGVDALALAAAPPRAEARPASSSPPQATAAAAMPTSAKTQSRFFKLPPRVPAAQS